MPARLLIIAATLCCLGAGRPEPQALADAIDRRIDAKLLSAKAKPGSPADDAEFLRRASLDLTGRIPTVADVRRFLADADPAKRDKLIDELLETPRHASHFAAVWRAALAPETSSIPEARVFRVGFERFLRDRFRANTPYDVVVRELIAAPVSSDAESPTPVLRRPEDANPLAFLAVKEAKPENLAAATSRVFLGVQLECAQCHDHPFAKWTRDQFWNTAAFFAGLERPGENMFAPVSEKTSVHSLTPVGKKRPTPALFLDEREPDWKADVSPRAHLAAWVTAKDNAYFSRAAVNRVWGQMFGRGLVDPVDDFRDDRPPSHPELLDELAKAFADADFDVRYLIRGITRTKAYRRTSALTDPSQAEPALFARMAVKGLTGEQTFDSLQLATGRQGESGREQVLTRFAAGATASEPETSIPQALALMNGRQVAESPTLLAACETPGLTADERVEVLYLAALGRKPSDRERGRMATHVRLGGTGREAERLADVFWVLLNSAEFRLNH